MNAIANAVRGMESFAFPVKSGILSGLSTRHIVLAVLFAAGYDILGQLGFIDFTVFPFASRWKGFSHMPFHLAIALTAVLAAVAVDNTFKAGTVRAIRYPTAVLMAAVVGTWILEMSSPHITERSMKALAALAQLGDARLILLTEHFLKSLYICILVVTLHAVLEASHKAGSALHQARLQALTEERGVCESELRAMQARVDPELLFESLGAVDDAYARDPALGQIRLEALIRFLRAALPGKAAGRSTVEHEKELAEAYAALVAPENSTASCPDFRASPAVLREVMPPMIVLPLVRWALANESAESLRITVNRRDRASGATLELIVENGHPVTSVMHGDEIAIVRRRLESLYAKDVRFDVSDENNRRRAVVEFPASVANTGDVRVRAG